MRTKEYDVLRALLKELRQAKGLSQEALSAKMGRPITFVGKIETGTRRLDLIELMEVASGLEIDITAIVEDLKRRLAD